MFKFRNLLLCFCLTALVAPAAGAAEFGFFGFDVRGGVVLPSDYDTGFIIGGSANIGEIVDGLYLYPGVYYSQAEEDIDLFFGDVTLEVTSLAIGAEVRYFLDRQQSGWYFGGGPYLNFLERDFVVGGRSRVVTADSEEIGVTGVAGYALGSGGRGLMVEGRYSVVSGFDTAQVLVGFGF